VCHYACRDRNLLGMLSDLLGGAAMGLHNLLLVTGDPPKMGPYPDATAVFDIDSIGLTNLVRNLNRGLDPGGTPIGAPTRYTIGVGVNPAAIDPSVERERFDYKVEAGAEFAITQPVFDPRQLERFLREIGGAHIPIVAGIWPLVSLRNAEFLANEVPGVVVPDEILERMRVANRQSAEHAVAEGIAIAREMLTAKGQNQAQLLKLYARYRARTNPALGHLLEAAIAVMERNVAAFAAVDGPSIEAVRGRFLAIEGRIAAAHFRAIAALLGPEWGFTTRTRQKEGFDAVNSTLDYLYGLLYTTCHRSLAAAGLDPRLGFVHTDGQEGKLSLLYDFVEAFRALGADRPALALLTRGSKVSVRQSPFESVAG